MQVESRINQDSNIAQQLTLWDQKGSRTFKGNLMVIPINQSILYVEPLYLQAEQSQIPELRRVIMVYGDRVVMEETLEQGLAKLFAPGKEPKTSAQEIDKTPETDSTIAELIAKRASMTKPRRYQRRRLGRYGATLSSWKRYRTNGSGI